MANDNFTPAAQGGYQHTGNVTPISTLTADSQLLSLADRLAQQGRAIDQAHLADRHFDYHPIPIPQKFQHIFG